MSSRSWGCEGASKLLTSHRSPIVHLAFLLLTPLPATIRPTSAIRAAASGWVTAPRALIRPASAPQRAYCAGKAPRQCVLRSDTRMASSQASARSEGGSSLLLPYMSEFRRRANLVLASKSPRRIEILQLMGFSADEIRVQPSTFEEDLDKAAFARPQDYTLATATAKAKEVATQLFSSPSDVSKTTVVVGADTIVEVDGLILEKPSDEQHAYEMLKSLSGRTHLVHTAVAIFTSRAKQPLETVSGFSETTEVRFAALSDDEIWEYVRSGEPMDKAGSYGIQGIGGQLVQSLNGCYFTVMGFPMHRFSRALGQMMRDGLL